MISHLRMVALILAAAFLLTILTTTISLAQQPEPTNKPPTPNQQALINAKERARQQAGAPSKPSPDTSFAQDNQPVRLFTGKVQTTKAELLALVAAAENAEQADLTRLEREGHANVAQQRRDELNAERRRIKALPDGPIELEIPGAEIGQHSISFSGMTYDSSSPKDPINVIFYRVGSAWDVNFDLKNWTSTRWQDTTCNSTQWVYIWDSSHTGGRDDWRQNQYPMTPGTVCYPEPRDHIRMFEGLVADSHSPGFGVWSVVAAHHDNYWHNCTDDWEGPEGRLKNAFKDSNGNSLWFVGAMWEADIGNAGRYQCADNNGRAQVIELLR